MTNEISKNLDGSRIVEIEQVSHILLHVKRNLKELM